MTGFPNRCRSACSDRTLAWAAPLEGTVSNAEQTTETTQGYQVLFPVAVGAVFLLALVVGALVG